MSYKREPSTAVVDLVKTETGATCFFCGSSAFGRHTNYALVHQVKMLRICGPHARGLMKVLPEVDKGDDR